MKFFLCVLTIIVINSNPINSQADPGAAAPTARTATHAAPITTINSTLTIAPAATNPAGCDCLHNKVRLYRLYNAKTQDHFYTTSLTEANNAATASSGYKYEQSPGFVFPKTAICLCNVEYVPVYRLYRVLGSKTDHFYTTSVAEASTAAKNSVYKWEGIAFYCSVNPGNCGTCGNKLPFYRYYRNIDHFYTTNLDEGFANVIPYVGTSYEGILCYIWAN